MVSKLTYKPTVPVEVNFLPGKNGEISSEETMQKFDQLIGQSLEYIEQFLKDYDCEASYSTFEYCRIQLDKEKSRIRDGIKIVIFVEDIEKASSMDAAANGNRSEFHIPQKKVDELPDDLLNIGQFTENEKDLFEEFLNYFLHEILHLLGAFHANIGIMSGRIDLFEQGSVDFQLIKALDEFSAGLVAGIMVDQTYIKPPSVTFTFDKQSRLVKFLSEVEITTVLFLEETYYTKKFYYTKDANFSCIVPEDSVWDSLLIQLVHGGILYYAKSAIYDNGTYDFRVSR